MENTGKDNEIQFTSIEHVNGRLKVENCEGDACGYIQFETTYHPNTNYVKAIVLTNSSEKNVSIDAAWGNYLGGCGVGPFLFSIAAGSNTTLRFPSRQMIAGYCKFKAHFTNSINSAIEGEENLLQNFINRIEDGSLEAAIFADSKNGNRVWFWKEENYSYLRMVNETEEPQRTNYMVRVRVDGRWRLHSSGHFIVQPGIDYTQEFHTWNAEDWTAQF